jgi:tRNA A22 N-methylase
MKTIIFTSVFCLYSAMSLARCLTDKENREIQNRYTQYLEKMEKLKSRSSAADQKEFNRLDKESSLLEDVMEEQEDQCE